MSIQGNFAGNVQVPVSQELANGTTTKIGDTRDDDSLTLAGFVIANDSGGAVVTSVYWYDFATTTERLVWKKSVAQNDTEIVSDMPLWLRTGDEIRVKAAADVHVTLIYMFNFALNRP